MKATSIEQIREHLQKGGMVMCHYDCRGTAYKKMPDRVYVIWNDKMVVDGWEKREHAFDSIYVDHWELWPIKEEHDIPKNFWERMDEPPDDSAFLSLPITFEEVRWEGPFGSRVTRQGTVAELLETWDIDDESEKSEMAQVLRHLRKAMR